MDVKYFGPSGWQLLHLITFIKGGMEHKQKLFEVMPDVLPCKYCRESTKQFVKEMPMDYNMAYWLYKLHDRVNKKLEDQHKEDPSVEKPVPSPSFKDVVEMYRKTLRDLAGTKKVVGRDFLMSVAYNYDPEIHNKESHKQFWEELKYVYPAKNAIKRLIYVPDMTSQKTYVKDVYAILSEIGTMPSFKGISQRLAYYKSGCNGKSYKGKTCRRLPAGGYTKQRDRRRTHRVTHSALL